MVSSQQFSLFKKQIFSYSVGASFTWETLSLSEQGFKSVDPSRNRIVTLPYFGKASLIPSVVEEKANFQAFVPHIFARATGQPSQLFIRPPSQHGDFPGLPLVIIRVFEGNPQLPAPVSNLMKWTFEQEGDLCIWADAQKFVICWPPWSDQADLVLSSSGCHCRNGMSKFARQDQVRSLSQ
jgi:hypothetical protein